MRILLLTPVHREIEYLRQRQPLTLLRFQAQSAWVSALQTLGHNVSVFRYTDSVLISNEARIYLKDFFEKLFPIWTARFLRIKSKFYFLSLENFLRNKKLLSIADKTKPELIVISGGVSNIYPTTIKKIKDKYDCRVLLFSGINPNIAATSVEKIMIRNGIVDIVVENDRGYAKRWERLGAQETIVLPISSVDPKLHRIIRLTKKEHGKYFSEVCFVGTLTPDRQQTLTKLLGFNIKIWGDIPPGLNLDERLVPYYFREAFGEKMVKIFNAAKIVLNFQPQDMTHGGNMRTFEISGCGAFQLANKIDPDFLTEGREFVSFNNFEDLRNKIGHYLQNSDKRLKIARYGFDKVHKEHTYEKHFKKLLSQI